MDEKTFLEKLEEIMNVEEDLTMDTKLAGLEEWDSLVALMFQSFVFKTTGKAPRPSAIAVAETVRDLYTFVK